jgi:hypothetical protein
MIAGYRLILVSAVGERDGVAVELDREDGTPVAEVFEDDATGQKTVSLFEGGIAVEAIEWMLAEARTSLSPPASGAGTPTPLRPDQT